MIPASTITRHRSSLRTLLVSLFLLAVVLPASATKLLIPMDGSQRNHLKAYGIAFWTLGRDATVEWLLNYRGGSFLIDHYKEVEQECTIRGVSFQIIADAQAATILAEIGDPEANMDVVKLEKAPKIAVYAPEGFQPWRW